MYEVVVGIDFGSSGTGYAYSFMDKNRIIHGEIPGSGVDQKVPTEIILDDNNNVIHFGVNCINHLKEKTHYFKGIKMQLYEKKSKIVSVNSGKELDLIIVIQKVLEEIKKIAIEKLSMNRPYLAQQTGKIKWVVTVPAIWDDYQKNVMMESCIRAGLVNANTDKSLFFALEPEAASLYCSINKEIDRKYFNKGEYYIVCDLGGGTGDIVAHLVGSNNNLNEISPSCGGIYGSNEINKLFFKDVIGKLFGCHDFISFYLKYSRNKNNNDEMEVENEEGMDELYQGWCEFESHVKMFKESSGLKQIENNETYNINCSLFKSIVNEDINKLVNEYNDKIDDISVKLSVGSKNRWIVKFPYQIIFNYMKTQAISICDKINSINSKEEIKTLIFVGGYCHNEIIVNLIKLNLKKINTYLQPSYPYLAVMEGAVLFGIEPSTIDIRKAKYTIGEGLDCHWDDCIHKGKGEKYFDEDFNDWYCKDCFKTFVEINQDIKYGEAISNYSYINKGQKVSKCHFYKTEKINPVFDFEEGVIKIGECLLDLGESYENLEDREIETTMKFGGTFIDVTAKHLKSGKSVKTILTFD